MPGLKRINPFFIVILVTTIIIVVTIYYYNRKIERLNLEMTRTASSEPIAANLQNIYLPCKR